MKTKPLFFALRNASATRNAIESESTSKLPKTRICFFSLISISPLENAVFIELARVCRKRGGKIHFWRTKQKTEVDFVIELGRELIPIEVKYNMSGTALSPGMIGFIKKFEPKKAIVATLIKPESVIRGAPAPVSIAYPYELGDIFARNV